MKNKAENIEEVEIDLIKLTRTVWDGKNIIIKTILVFLFIALLYAFGSKNEYEATCKLMPEIQENIRPNLGGLGNLAGLAGFNIDMGNKNALLPEHYPLITQSLPFQQKLLNEKIGVQKLDTIIRLYDYFLEFDRSSIFEIIYNYTVGLPFHLRSILRSKENRFNDKKRVEFQYNNKWIV